MINGTPPTSSGTSSSTAENKSPQQTPEQGQTPASTPSTDENKTVAESARPLIKRSRSGRLAIRIGQRLEESAKYKLALNTLALRSRGLSTKQLDPTEEAEKAGGSGLLPIKNISFWTLSRVSISLPNFISSRSIQPQEHQGGNTLKKGNNNWHNHKGAHNNHNNRSLHSHGAGRVELTDEQIAQIEALDLTEQEFRILLGILNTGLKKDQKITVDALLGVLQDIKNGQTSDDDILTVETFGEILELIREGIAEHEQEHGEHSFPAFGVNYSPSTPDQEREPTAPSAGSSEEENAADIIDDIVGDIVGDIAGGEEEEEGSISDNLRETFINFINKIRSLLIPSFKPLPFTLQAYYNRNKVESRTSTAEAITQVSKRKTEALTKQYQDDAKQVALEKRTTERTEKERKLKEKSIEQQNLNRHEIERDYSGEKFYGDFSADPDDPIKQI